MSEHGTGDMRGLDRRGLLRGLALAGVTSTLGALGPVRADEEKAVRHGRIKQSIAYWCFSSAGEKWNIEKTCEVARLLGCPSIELVNPGHWPVLKKHGLICALASNGMPGPSFARGWNNPRYHEEVATRTRETIDLCAEAGFPAVIAFTGYQWRDALDPKSGTIPREEGMASAVKGLKGIAGYAEKKGVTICLEHLNTRDDSHPMKGHPGYQGDNLDEVASIVRQVGSPRVRLLFDIYHVQVMHGDVMRRLEQNRDILGHIHTAGNPGRGELDDTQEISYAPIMRKLLELKYDGYVGQEFIPTRSPLESLRHAVRLCDV